MKIIRIRARELEAGDILVVKVGTIRKFYHVCEINETKKKVDVTYNVSGGFEHVSYKPRDVVRVRDY